MGNFSCKAKSIPNGVHWFAGSARIQATNIAPTRATAIYCGTAKWGQRMKCGGFDPNISAQPRIDRCDLWPEPQQLSPALRPVAALLSKFNDNYKAKEISNYIILMSLLMNSTSSYTTQYLSQHDGRFFQ
jgi:hypothetical protein